MLDQLQRILALAYQLYGDLTDIKALNTVDDITAQALDTAIALNEQMFSLVQRSFASEADRISELEVSRDEVCCSDVAWD